jgi:hypothetical protein
VECGDEKRARTKWDNRPKEEAQAAEIERLREALGLFDDLIEHQYSGSQEAMSDMAYAAQNAARILKRGAWAALEGKAEQ